MVQEALLAHCPEQLQPRVWVQPPSKSDCDSSTVGLREIWMGDIFRNCLGRFLDYISTVPMKNNRNTFEIFQ